MTPDLLRGSIAVVLRVHGVKASARLVELLAAIADHHAAEEVAASHAGAEVP